LKAILYYAKRPVSLCRVIFGRWTPLLRRMDYEGYWEAKRGFGISTRYPVFADIIEQGASVLDMGCGNGATLAYLAERKGVRGEGVDIAHEAVDAAREKGVRASVGDIASPEYALPGTYDYVILSEVLEHVPSPEEVIAKVRGRFRRRLILSLPNIGHYTHRLRLLFGRFPIQWAYHPGEHLRFWTLRDFREWLAWMGFAVEREIPYSGVPGLRRVWPSLFADSVILVVKEAPAGDAPA